jgi:hypothetical protein
VPSECLSIEALAAIFAGGASEEEVARGLAHLRACPDCRGILLLAAEAETTPEAPDEESEEDSS